MVDTIRTYDNIKKIVADQEDDHILNYYEIINTSRKLQIDCNGPE